MQPAPPDGRNSHAHLPHARAVHRQRAGLGRPEPAAAGVPRRRTRRAARRRACRHRWLSGRARQPRPHPIHARRRLREGCAHRRDRHRWSGRGAAQYTHRADRLRRERPAARATRLRSGFPQRLRRRLVRGRCIRDLLADRCRQHAPGGQDLRRSAAAWRGSAGDPVRGRPAKRTTVAGRTRPVTGQPIDRRHAARRARCGRCRPRAGRPLRWHRRGQPHRRDELESPTCLRR